MSDVFQIQEPKAQEIQTFRLPDLNADKNVADTLASMGNPTTSRQRVEAARLMTTAFPHLSQEQAYDNLDQLFEILTGNKTADSMNPVDVIKKTWQEHMDSRELAYHRYMMDHPNEDPLANIGKPIDQVELDTAKKMSTWGEIKDDYGLTNIQQRAQRIAELQNKPGLMTPDSPQWWAWINSAADFGASMADLGSEAVKQAASGSIAAAPASGLLSLSLSGVGAATSKAAPVVQKALGLATSYEASRKVNFYPIYSAMRDQGVSVETATQTANVTAAAVAALDSASLGTDILIGKAGYAVLKNVMQKASQKALTSGQFVAALGKVMAGQVAGGVASETMTETMQEAIQIIGENAALELDAVVQNEPALLYLKTDWEKAWPRLADVAQKTAMGTLVLAGIGLPGETIAASRSVTGAAKTVEQAREVGTDIHTTTTLARKPIETAQTPEGVQVTPGAEAAQESSPKAPAVATGYFVADPGLTTGHIDAGRYTGDGVQILGSEEAALALARKNSTAPINAQAFMASVKESQLPGWIGSMVQDVIQEGPAARKKYQDQITTWEKDNPGMDATELVDLADSIRNSTTLDGRNAILAKYSLESAIPPGAIRTMEIRTDKTATVDKAADIRKAFSDGAQAVQFAGDWYIKDAAVATPVSETKTDDPKVVKAVGDYQVRKDGDTYRAVAADGTELGTLKVETDAGRISVRDVMVQPEFRRQGVATALMDRATQDNPDAIPDWTRASRTTEGRALRDSYRRKGPMTKRYAAGLERVTQRAQEIESTIKRLEELGTDEALETKAEWEQRLGEVRAHQVFLEETLDRQRNRGTEDPAAMTPEQYRQVVKGPELSRESMLRVLEIQLGPEQAETALGVLDQFAKYLGKTTTEMLGQTLDRVELVNHIRYQGKSAQGDSVSKYANGMYHLNKAKERTLTMAAKGNVTTFLHEYIHALYPVLSDTDKAQIDRAFADYRTRNSDFEDTYEGKQEWLSRSFELYAFKGEAPASSGLKRIFDRLAIWFKWIYEGLTRALPQELHPEAKALFDRMLTVANDAPIAEGTDGSVAPAPWGLFQPAYHGTPHHFNKFTTAAMGTGEGAQVYGWGLYFAGNKEIAEWYRKNLEKMTVYYDGVPLESTGLDKETQARLQGLLFNTKQKTPKEAIAHAIKNMSENMAKEEDPFYKARIQAGIDAYISLDASKVEMKRGQLYEVEIPDQAEYLDWDKSYDDQSDGVKEKLATIGIETEAQVSVVGDGPDGPMNDRFIFNNKKEAEEFSAEYEKKGYNTSILGAGRDKFGEEIYRDLIEQYGSDKEASLALKAAGIPGITYLDGSSRGGLQHIPITPEREAEITARLLEIQTVELPATKDAGRYAELTNEQTALHKELAHARAKKPDYNYVIFADEDIQIVRKFYQEDLELSGERDPLYTAVDRLVSAEPLELSPREIPESVKDKKAWMMENAPKGIFTNTETGRSISIPNSAVRKMARFSANGDRASITPDLGRVLEAATFLFPEENMKPEKKPHVSSVGHYGKIISRAGSTELLLITTEVQNGVESVDMVENWHLEKEKGPGSPLNEGGVKANPEALLPHKNRIIQILREVNHPKFLFQDDTPADQIEAVRSQYEGTPEWMKAPNGKPTNYFESQWLKVRTQAFKEWFGPWDTEPAKASKIVDENGEPLIVYHETTEESKVPIFQEGFKTGKPGASSNDEQMPIGTFLKPTSEKIGVARNGIQIPLFTAIKNPLVVADRAELESIMLENEEYKKLRDQHKEADEKGLRENDKFQEKYKDPKISDEEMDRLLELEEKQLEDWNNATGSIAKKMREVVTQEIKSRGHDGLVVEKDAGSFGRSVKTIVAFSSEQVKSVNNRGTWDPSNPRPMFQEAGDTDSPEFKAWFGDSKVVDDQGKPLVVYHGSAHAGIEAFDISKAESVLRGDWGEGIYFTPSKSTANYYRENAVKTKDEASNLAFQAWEEKAKSYGTSAMGSGMDLGKGKITQEQFDQLKEMESAWRKERAKARELDTGKVYSVYLSLQNPMIYKYEGITNPFLDKQAKEKGYDGIIIMERDGSIGEYVAFSPSQIKSVNNTGAWDPEDPRILYQTDPEYRDATRQIRENEALIREFRNSMDDRIAEQTRGKGPDFREEFIRQQELLLKGMEAKLAEAKEDLDKARSAAAEAAQARGEEYDPHMEFTREAVLAGKVVPTESLLAYRDQEWAEAELARREMYRELIEEAREFKDVEDWLEEIRSWEAFSDEPKSAEVEAEAQGDKGKSEDIYREIFIASRIQTAADADKKFLEDLDEAKVKEILLAIGRNAAAETFQNLPVQITGNAKRIQKNEVREDQLAQAAKIIKGNPRLYRRIYWTYGPFGRDQALTEMLALELDEETFMNEVDPPEVKVEKVVVPTDAELEYRTRAILGDRGAMFWRDEARRLAKEVDALDDQITALEKEGDTREREALQAGREARNSAAQEMKLAMGEKLEAMEEAKSSAIEEATLQERIRKNEALNKLRVEKNTKLEELKLTYKTKLATLKAARKMREYHNQLAKAIMAPVGNTIMVDYKIQIESLQELLDPKNRATKTEAEKARLQKWFLDHPEAMGRMTRKTKIETFGKSLNLWTTEELENLRDDIQALRDQGRAEKAAKDRAWNDEIQNYISRVYDALYRDLTKLYDEQTKEKDPTRREELAKKILSWEARKRDLNQAKAETFENGNIPANLLTISNLADRMDGGLENFSGVNHELLYTIPKRAENEKLRIQRDRMEKLFAWMKDNDVTMDELGDKIKFTPQENWEWDGKKFTPKTRTMYTVDELLTVYVGQLNEMKREALAYGNRISPEVVKYVMESDQFKKFRALGDRIIREYGENVDRLQAAFHDYENKILKLEENYTPMERQNVSYEAMEEQLSWEKGQAYGALKPSTDKKMTIDRIKIAPDHQLPIRMGEMSLWLKNVGRQEQYINMAPVVKRLNQVYGNRDINTAVIETQGNAVASEIKEYIRLLANPFGNRTYIWIESVSAKVRGNAAVAYMAWNPVTVMKQTPALAQYLPYTDVGCLMSALGDLAKSQKKLWESTDKMSEQVRSRVALTELQDLEAGRLEGGSRVLKKFNNLGMKGIPTMDKIIVLVGWNAVHRKAMADGMTDTQAREYADFITNKTQATTSVMDTSGIFRKPSELTRALTMFAGPTNKILNEVAYTIPKALKNRQYWKAGVVGASYLLGAVAIWMLAKGRVPDEPEEYLQAIGMQTLDLVPILGAPLSAQWRGWGEFTPPIMQPLFSGAKAAEAAGRGAAYQSEGKMEKAKKAYETAILEALESAGLAFQVPVTQPKRIWRAIRNKNGWELLGWRKEEEE